VKRKGGVVVEYGQAALFERYVIVWVHIVDSDHFTTGFKKPPAEMKTDKSGGTGYQDSFTHFCSTPSFSKIRLLTFYPNKVPSGLNPWNP
jgi:hypothetical protein